jgi:hypothetical protein
MSSVVDVQRKVYSHPSEVCSLFRFLVFIIIHRDSGKEIAVRVRLCCGEKVISASVIEQIRDGTARSGEVTRPFTTMVIEPDDGGISDFAEELQFRREPLCRKQDYRAKQAPVPERKTPSRVMLSFDVIVLEAPYLIARDQSNIYRRRV